MRVDIDKLEALDGRLRIEGLREAIAEWVPRTDLSDADADDVCAALELIPELVREVRALRGIAEFLFDRLDDIDTCFDAFKGNDEAFKQAVDRLHKRRFEVGETDGYTVTWKMAEYDAGGAK